MNYKSKELKKAADEFHRIYRGLAKMNDAHRFRQEISQAILEHRQQKEEAPRQMTIFDLGGK